MKVSSIIVMVLVLFLFPFYSHSGFFGYSNYDDCVIEKMKGQDKSLKYNVDRFCREKFPKAKDITKFANNKIRFRIHDIINNDEVKVEIVENSTEYKITKAILSFTEENCDYKQLKNGAETFFDVNAEYRDVVYREQKKNGREFIFDNFFKDNISSSSRKIGFVPKCLFIIKIYGVEK